MIFRPSLPGFFNFQKSVMKASVLGPLVLVPVVIYENINIVPGYLWLNIILYTLGFYAFGYLLFHIIIGFQFRGRTDPYIYQSYFALKDTQTDPSILDAKLEKLGYVLEEDCESCKVYKKSETVAQGIGGNISESWTWYLRVSKSPEVDLFFYVKGIDGFDGRQISYKGYEEVKKVV